MEGDGGEGERGGERGEERIRGGGFLKQRRGFGKAESRSWRLESIEYLSEGRRRDSFLFFSLSSTPVVRRFFFWVLGESSGGGGFFFSFGGIA